MVYTFIETASAAKNVLAITYQFKIQNMDAEIIAIEQCPNQKYRWVVIEVNKDINVINFVITYTKFPYSKLANSYPIIIYEFLT